MEKKASQQERAAVNRSSNTHGQKPQDKDLADGAAVKEHCSKSIRTQPLTISILIFSLIATAATLVAFFFSVFTDDNENASKITDLYILFMILVIPTLTVFLDKPDCNIVKNLNRIGLGVFFSAVFIMTIVSVIVMGFGV